MKNICEWTNCRESGDFKAPLERDNSKNYKWLCEEHVKLFNKNWNYFDGMRQNEIEDFLKSDLTWHRPTQKFGSSDNFFNILWNNALSDKFNFFKQELDLDQNATYGETEKKLSIMGADLLVESLKNIEDDTAKFTNQIHSQATYAKKIDKNETRINWSLDVSKVIAHIHGLSPNPGAWFEYENERFKVLKANKSSANGNPGTVLDENLTVACKSDSIQILEIQRQGKNKQTNKDFLLGKKISKGSILT